MHDLIFQSDLSRIYSKVLAGERLTLADGVRLYESPHLAYVGHMANKVRERLNGDKAYFVRNQHINYTNICQKDCKFCSFYAKKGGPDAYVLSPEDIAGRVRRYIDEPVTEIHMVGGIHPRLPYSYYLDVLSAIRQVRSRVHIKAWTMVELAQIHKVGPFDSLGETLADLRRHGLDSCPGGGAEVLSERVHQELFGKKLDSGEWLDIARIAHRSGLRTNATMLYGHIETYAERVEHMIRLRDLQDETGGFLTFIPLAMDPTNTELDDVRRDSGIDDLRNIAVARLMLDNFDHIKAFWIMITPSVAQTSLWYGADDMDGTILEYEITHVGVDAKNHRQSLSRKQMIRLIENAGREPVERDTLYNRISDTSDVLAAAVA